MEKAFAVSPDYRRSIIDESVATEAEVQDFRRTPQHGEHRGGDRKRRSVLASLYRKQSLSLSIITQKKRSSFLLKQEQSLSLPITPTRVIDSKNIAVSKNFAVSRKESDTRSRDQHIVDKRNKDRAAPPSAVSRVPAPSLPASRVPVHRKRYRRWSSTASISSTIASTSASSAAATAGMMIIIYSKIKNTIKLPRSKACVGR